MDNNVDKWTKGIMPQRLHDLLQGFMDEIIDHIRYLTSLLLLKTL